MTSAPFPAGVSGAEVAPPLAELRLLLTAGDVSGGEVVGVAVSLAGADVLVLAVAVLLAAALEEGEEEEVVAEPCVALELVHGAEVFCGADLSDAPELAVESVGVSVVSVALGLELAVVLLLTLGLGLLVVVVEVP